MSEHYLLHKLDKDIAILKAITIRHMKRTDKDLAEIKKNVDSLKVKVAVTAATISLVIGGLSIWLATF